jgi:adenosine kinase
MRREFGGCAGNIAYSLRMIGGDPLIMATVGEDYAPYAERLEKLELSQRHVRKVAGAFTAQAFITTDIDDNQITAFHPGAMNHSHENRVRDAVTGAIKGRVQLGIIAPDGREGMLQHAREFHEAGVPFIFDPGQGLPMFNGEELFEFVRMADYVTVNDYEAQLLQERTGQTIEALAKLAKAFVVTLGARGSIVYTERGQLEIPSVKAETIVDPTGCGDAFRAGLLYGLAADMDWATTGRLASLMGALKIAHRGGQNHSYTRDEIGERYYSSFGTRIW